MRFFAKTRAVVSLVLALALFSPPALAAPIALRADIGKSDFRVELGKSGFLRAFGDEHLIRVTDYQCDVLLDEQDLTHSSVSLIIRSASLQVADPNVPAERRAEVQKRMQGADVLEIARFPEVRFASTRITAAGAGRFRVEGQLTIRGIAQPVVMDVAFGAEGPNRRARGETRIRQTAFGIQPVTAGAGTVKVKDEMRIVFDLLLAPVRP